nr:immunoglobulin light chain junction region [Macaca mulatta]MOW36697.1 immunoglobulin light chain junction region [Macaca mulatta]MOW37658.1 immunoglobulin light chain junction region [Macaca mulatta]MOW38287.1 immunoglobulin light chain junction region [Macaca mulatta]MOW38709.1 immunoglobulin light chain junction region [Macaca mulatta]
DYYCMIWHNYSVLF